MTYLLNKSLLMFIGLLFLLCSHLNVHAQGVIYMNEGETYTFPFYTLPYSHGTTDQPPLESAGKLDGYISMPVGSSYLVEMFEDATSLLPIHSDTITSSPGFPPPPGPFSWVIGAWQDLEGSVRITMLSGSAAMSWMVATSIREENGTFNWYSAYLSPVPEPHVLSFIACAILLCLIRSRKYIINNHSFVPHTTLSKARQYEKR